MTEPLSAEEVAHVAHLARLRLSPDELQQFTLQLRAVLAHAAELDALRLDDVEPTAHPLTLVNALRPDIEGPTLNPEEVLAVAPEVEEGQFRVPPVLGEVS